MDTTVIVLIVVVVLLVIALVAAGILLSRRRRRERIQEHYGTEYDRALEETGDPREAEALLTERERRVQSLDVRELRAEERDRFGDAWAAIQRDFVDDPVQAVRDADGLVVDIMRTRGYPVDDFEQRAADVSVEHPDVVQRYRDARVVRDATEHGTADTEQQRHAVTSYRALVEALLGTATLSADGRRDQSDATVDDQRAGDRTPGDTDGERSRDEDDPRAAESGRHQMNGHRSAYPTPEETR